MRGSRKNNLALLRRQDVKPGAKALSAPTTPSWGRRASLILQKPLTMTLEKYRSK
jgi:hypothetical protein